MPRHKKCRFISAKPGFTVFKPAGKSTVELEKIILTVDEFEAFRLADFECTSQEDGAKKMGISRATFGRIIEHARKTIADSIINGKALIIEGGEFCSPESMKLKNKTKCRKCQLSIIDFVHQTDLEVN